MADYTPTTAEVRANYALAVNPFQSAEMEERFDRWLAEHDGEIEYKAQSALDYRVSYALGLALRTLSEEDGVRFIEVWQQHYEGQTPTDVYPWCVHDKPIRMCGECADPEPDDAGSGS